MIRGVLGVLSALIVLGCFAVAFERAATAPAPKSPRRLDAVERQRAAGRLAGQERAWLSGARRQFPGDRWSQSDHFHNVEHLSVRNEAARLGASEGDILYGIDESLRENPGDRVVGAAPCKPRPFYQ